jgi:hypothetical protein
MLRHHHTDIFLSGIDAALDSSRAARSCLVVSRPFIGLYVGATLSNVKGGCRAATAGAIPPPAARVVSMLCVSVPVLVFFLDGDDECAGARIAGTVAGGLGIARVVRADLGTSASAARTTRGASCGVYCSALCSRVFRRFLFVARGGSDIKEEAQLGIV